VVRFKHGGLGRRCTVRWVHSPRELGNRVVLVLGRLRRRVCIAAAEVDELGWVRYLLASPLIFDKVCDVLLHVTVFERQSDLLARSIVAHTNGRGYVSKSPEAALGVIDALLLEILEFLWSC